MQRKGLGVSRQARVVREQNMLGIVELTHWAQMMQSLPGLNFLAWAVGWQEILVIVVVVLILFGGRKIPELARGIGRGMREFKREMRGVKEDFDEAMKEEEEDYEPRSRPRKKRKKPAGETAQDAETSETDDSKESK
jgi:sec-independent protein translocase protein TatA